MPEGDTVARQCRVLHEALAGATLTASDLRVPRAATADLVGWSVREVRPRGKHLLIRLEPPATGGVPLTLHTHLMMDGIWHVDGRRCARATPAPGHARRTRSASSSPPVTRTDARPGPSPTT